MISLIFFTLFSAVIGFERYRNHSQVLQPRILIIRSWQHGCSTCAMVSVTLKNNDSRRNSENQSKLCNCEDFAVLFVY